MKPISIGCGPMFGPMRDRTTEDGRQVTQEQVSFVFCHRLLSSDLQERIGRSFPAAGAGRPMSADDRNVVSQWQELVADRLQQLPVIPSGKIAAADGTREQHVAHNGQTLVRTEKDDASRRVPGTMQDL